MYTKNSHRRYTALALSLANLQSAQDAHTYRLPSGRAAPRATPSGLSLFLRSQPPMQHPLSPGRHTLPSPKHRPRASPRASSLTRPDRTPPALNTSPKENHTQGYTDHTRFCTQAAFTRERATFSLLLRTCTRGGAYGGDDQKPTRLLHHDGHSSRLMGSPSSPLQWPTPPSIRRPLP